MFTDKRLKANKRTENSYSEIDENKALSAKKRKSALMFRLDIFQ